MMGPFEKTSKEWWRASYVVRKHEVSRDPRVGSMSGLENNNKLIGHPKLP